MIGKKAMFGLALLLAAGVETYADVQMSSIFGDHMVLQQQTRLPVWGKADPGEKVSVEFNSAKAETVADRDGNWTLTLPPQAAAAKGGTMTVTGKNKLTFSDVLVGDVWHCSGQSNMAWNLGRADGGEEIVNGKAYPEIRFFLIVNTARCEPQFSSNGKWMVWSPRTVKAFSAIAVFFGIEMFDLTKQPVGLISTCFGGASAQAFISPEVLQKAFPRYYNDLQKFRAAYPAAKAAYDAAKPEFDRQRKAWQNAPETKAFFAARNQYRKDRENAQRKGEPFTRPEPQPATPEPKLPGVEPNQRLAGALYNGSILPVMPYAIKGVIWYQGESNSGKPLEFQRLTETVIKDWRARWGQGDFPFYFVQLANFKKRDSEPATDNNWAFLRESQTANLALPNTAMASAIDVGVANDVHPRDKKTVAHRLALLARKHLYGENIAADCPMFDKMEIQNGRAVITFRNTAKLSAKSGASELPGFAIAGADRKFVWAKAKLTGANRVEVWNDAVKAPVAVRYGWGNNPEIDLYGENEIPVNPFRTDDWNPSNLQ